MAKSIEAVTTVTSMSEKSELIFEQIFELLKQDEKTTFLEKIRKEIVVEFSTIEDIEELQIASAKIRSKHAAKFKLIKAILMEKITALTKEDPGNINFEIFNRKGSLDSLGTALPKLQEDLAKVVGQALELRAKEINQNALAVLIDINQ